MNLTELPSIEPSTPINPKLLHHPSPPTCRVALFSTVMGIAGLAPVWQKAARLLIGRQPLGRDWSGWRVPCLSWWPSPASSNGSRIRMRCMPSGRIR